MECGVFHTDYRTDIALRRVPAERVRLGLFVVAVLAFPLFASSYWLNLANQVAIATIGAIGLNILVGYTGQISLGQGAFMEAWTRSFKPVPCFTLDAVDTGEATQNS